MSEVLKFQILISKMEFISAVVTATRDAPPAGISCIVPDFGKPFQSPTACFEFWIEDDIAFKHMALKDWQNSTLETRSQSNYFLKTSQQNNEYQ